ncbi:hypothetical protein [Haliea sp. E17]|uniref:hypothetical protein n=1 Tax=Haliea sp. E17 TaxID=3401576 RepID=UPI003AB035B3
MGDKAIFEVRDLDPGTSSAEVKDGKKYMGIERRKQNRRSGMDRRTDVRYEPGKDDRRKDHGRRHDDNGPQFW